MELLTAYSNYLKGKLKFFLLFILYENYQWSRINQD